LAASIVNSDPFKKELRVLFLLIPVKTYYFARAGSEIVENMTVMRRVYSSIVPITYVGF
jgi:hypothetical protein